MIFEITSNKSILRTTIWAVSNICAGSVKHIYIVISHIIFDKIVYFLRDDDYSVKKETLFLITNISEHCNIDVIRTILDIGVLNNLIDILTESKDCDLITMCLNSFIKIFNNYYILNDYGIENYINYFKETEIINLFENLTLNPNKNISCLSEKILEILKN